MTEIEQTQVLKKVRIEVKGNIENIVVEVGKQSTSGVVRHGLVKAEAKT